MVIKMPKPTKAEIILSLFNQWDPLDYVDKAGFMFYNYEAEDLAQRIRKNTRPDKIAAIIQELMEEKEELEGMNKAIDPDECMQCAVVIHSWMQGK